MSDTKLMEMVEDGRSEQPLVTDFEALLDQAERLMAEGNTGDALDVLLALQEKYIAATRVFDLIGEVYTRTLDIKQGVRYKTLFDVLTSTLHAQRMPKPEISRSEQQVPLPVPTEQRVEEVAEEPEEAVAPVTHYTSAMAQEFVKQGHFDKAVEILDTLVHRHPEDDALRDARDVARKKLRERRLLGVLERWLENIEQMKMGRPQEHE